VRISLVQFNNVRLQRADRQACLGLHQLLGGLGIAGQDNVFFFGVAFGFLIGTADLPV
jgi:hypothetical protein